jgi:DNA-binding PadR family transcriptional regulator
LKRQNKNSVFELTKRRIFKGLIENYLLLELNNFNQLSGYDAIKIINKKFNLAPSPATVYSAFYSLERKGLVKPISENSSRHKKRVYMLTQDGQVEHLINQELEDQLVTFFRRVLIG